ncbi:hypothetical protein [Bdellovibrio sp. HCB288]|uniref:hypothetical protein n=1 Tax=Bdellovibrio sp. HCB288 TaxID=3394355 RepID=UPI0039B4EC83
MTNKPDFIKLLGLKQKDIQIRTGRGTPTDTSMLTFDEAISTDCDLKRAILVEDLQAALEERCKVVYSPKSQTTWGPMNYPSDTHTAFIFGETPIVREACVHSLVMFKDGNFGICDKCKNKFTIKLVEIEE